MIYLDTHAAVFLAMGATQEFSDVGKQAIEDHELLISPMVLLELEYLFEIKKLILNSAQVFIHLEKSIQLAVCDLDFQKVIRSATQEKWTREPFDRIIVTQAKLKKAQLLTKDRLIHQHYAKAFW